MIYVIIAIFFIVVTMFSLLIVKNQNNKAKKFLEENQDAVKVFFENKYGIKSLVIDVETVDGEKALSYFEGSKKGFVTKAGKRIVELSWQTTRPGLLYKNINEYYGPIKKELELKSGINYTLYYDEKENDILLKENI